MRVAANQPKELAGAKPNVRRADRDAFTIPELLITIALIFLLASILLPALTRAKEQGKSTICINNLRQLGLALHVYAGDHDDMLPYNMGRDGIDQTVASGELRNWANNVMSWELDSYNTNTMLLAKGGLGPYVSGVIKVFKCPSDTALSQIQKNEGWTERVRSVSMNAMLGNAGEFMMDGVNTNNPTYRQFIRLGEVPEPSRIFAFIEEHPDSINDGYFLNRFYSDRWIDLPASFHRGGAALAYADGHAEVHYWRFGHTKPPPRPDAAGLPLVIPYGQRGDYQWVMSQTSIHADEPAVASSYGGKMWTRLQRHH